MPALLTVISLFLPWFVSSVPRTHGEWAFTYSEAASVVVIVFFLATLFLVLYPAIAAELGLSATAVLDARSCTSRMGAVLLLLFDV